MKNLALSAAILGIALLPSAVLADWNGSYFGISGGNSSNGEMDVAITGFGPVTYPLDDSTTFGVYYGGMVIPPFLEGRVSRI